VSELTGQVNLSDWPEGTRLIGGRERLHPGAQLAFTDLDGHRFQCLITDQTDSDIAALEVLYRQHAQVDDRIKIVKATGAPHLPFHAFAPNAAWLELAQAALDRRHGLDAATNAREQNQICEHDCATGLHVAGQPPPRAPHPAVPTCRLALGRSDPPRVQSARSTPTHTADPTVSN
jgi:hypothetical protein